MMNGEWKNSAFLILTSEFSSEPVIRPVSAVAAAVAGLGEVDFSQRAAHAPDKVAVHGGQGAFARAECRHAAQCTPRSPFR